MYSLLCLGDSYTIGEGLPLYEAFPAQAVQQLRAAGYPFCPPEIVARTGWTTDELAHTLSTLRLLPQYDFVSLLIGVNNQYRGRDCSEYAAQFDNLLQTALHLTGSAAKLIVLSIPDWGFSPFAASRDKALISGEIDAFNEAAAIHTLRNKVRFIDITTHSRTAGAGPDAFTADGLHPAAATHHFWAQHLSDAIIATLPRQLHVD